MLQLLCSETSPYARKVRITVLELGLENQVQQVNNSPLESNAELLASNPLSKVPALRLANGDSLYDSRVICEYLDSLVEHKNLIPQAGDARWQCLKLQALADGMMDAAVAIIFERKRTDTMPSQYWLSRWEQALNRGLEHLDKEVDNLSQQFDLAAIAATATLGYLDFRHPQRDWRAEHPNLAAWHADCGKRESVRNTQPPS